jgi:hypothetical protein
MRLRPVSVTYTAPSGPAATSFRKPGSAAEKSTPASGAPVRRSKPRTASASATHSVSPTMVMPRGACSVTPPAPPATKRGRSTVPSGRMRLM